MLSRLKSRTSSRPTIMTSCPSESGEDIALNVRLRIMFVEVEKSTKVGA